MHFLHICSFPSPQKGKKHGRAETQNKRVKQSKKWAGEGLDALGIYRRHQPNHSPTSLRTDITWTRCEKTHHKEKVVGRQWKKANASCMRPTKATVYHCINSQHLPSKRLCIRGRLHVSHVTQFEQTRETKNPERRLRGAWYLFFFSFQPCFRGAVQKAICLAWMLGLIAAKPAYRVDKGTVVRWLWYRRWGGKKQEGEMERRWGEGWRYARHQQHDMNDETLKEEGICIHFYVCRNVNLVL